MTGLSPEEWAAQFHRVERTMLHLELRSFYAAGDEHCRAWLAGDDAPLDRRWPEYGDWLAMIRGHVARGVEVARARVVNDPPSDYQRWESWCAPLNAAAGETVWLLDRRTAGSIGVDPGPGGLDWWLFDDERVMLMDYDDGSGEMTRAWVSTDPVDVAAARHQWSLVLAHGRMEHGSAMAD